MNSAWDVKKFNMLKQLPQTSQIKSSTAPITKPTPITGGLSRQTTTTTTQTTAYNQEKYEACQKKNDSIFSKIDNGLCWLNNNMIQPAWNGTKKFGKAVYHSTSLEMGFGGGIGGNVKLGIAEISLYAVPFREEYVVASDCKTNVTGNYSIGATFLDVFGAEIEAKRTAYNNGVQRNPYNAPNGHWEKEMTLISSYTSLSGENDFNIEIGGGIYAYVGIDYTFSFNVSKFAKEMGLIRE